MVLIFSNIYIIYWWVGYPTSFYFYDPYVSPNFTGTQPSSAPLRETRSDILIFEVKRSWSDCSGFWVGGFFCPPLIESSQIAWKVDGQEKKLRMKLGSAPDDHGQLQIGHHWLQVGLQTSQVESSFRLIKSSLDLVLLNLNSSSSSTSWQFKARAQVRKNKKK